jgi:hypothetical protein
MTESAGDDSGSLSTENQGTQTDGSGSNRTPPFDEEIDSARQELLEESRTTLTEQLGQINKIDDAAVRTVRISLLILGILAGGARLAQFPDLGLAGAVGTVTLVFTVIGAVTVYGTSRVFIGSAPDDLAIDYTEKPIVENTYIEMLSEYDEGISDNRSTLRANGFILAIARTLLVISITTILYEFTHNDPTTAAEEATHVTEGVPTLIFFQSQLSNEMEESQSTGRSNEVSQSVSVYTGPKKIADAKVALGEWLEEHGL